MSSDFKPITIHDVILALDALSSIERPDGSDEGELIDSTSVYEDLSGKEQDLIDHAEKISGDYLRQNGKRGITELNKRGYKSNLNPDQYDPERLVGRVTAGDWLLDVSDPSNADTED
jgi:hypothetical protein